jgi:RNA polymerase sigma-70 factor (ECF subfamily)
MIAKVYKSHEFALDNRTMTKADLASSECTQTGSHYREDMILVSEILAGHKASFDLFYDQYYDKLFRFCVTRLDDEDAVYDIVQQTMERVVRYLKTYEGKASLYTWCCRICSNLIAAWYTTEAKHKAVSDDEEDVFSIIDRLSEQSVSDLQRFEISRVIQFVINGLPDNYCRILEQKYINGDSIDTISIKEEMSYVATESLLARARRKFKFDLENLTGLPLSKFLEEIES